MLKIRFHPIAYLILPTIYLLATFIAKEYQTYLLIVIMIIINLLIIEKRIKYKAMLIFLLSMTPIIIATFLSGYFFAVNLQHQQLSGYNIALRTFCIAFVSFSFSIHSPYPSIINDLMQRKIISINIGYALLAAFNSFTQLIHEFNKIQLAYKMRYHKTMISPKIIISLLVVAARYSHNLSISIYSRRLNKNKTFIQPLIPIRWFDYLLWFANLYLITFIVI